MGNVESIKGLGKVLTEGHADELREVLFAALKRLMDAEVSAMCGAEYRRDWPMPSSVTDAEWTVLEPLLAKAERRGRPQRHPRRAMLDAVVYVVRTGCQWRAIPEVFPAFPAVWSTFRRWRDDGTLDELYDTRYVFWRKQSGRSAVPTAGIIDSQTVKTSEKAGLAAARAARN